MGVDIIAGNDDTNLQPMVLGNNLVQALNGIIDQLNKVTSTVSGLVESQLALGIALGSHTHTGGTIYGMTGPSIEAALQSIPVVMKDMCMTFDNVTTKLNSEVERFKTLNKASSANILSDHNRVN